MATEEGRLKYMHATGRRSIVCEVWDAVKAREKRENDVTPS